LIGEKTGIRMDVEGRYKWIVFLPSKQFDVGALTRYYGVFESGELKVRGIELRQRNTPEFLREVQKNMLDVLSNANDSNEFVDLIPQAIEAMFECAARVINGSIEIYKLVFRTRISKGITEYKVNNLVKSALLQMRDLGFNVQPGQSISYIVLNEHKRDYRSRVKVIESIDGNEVVDVDYYLRQIAKCGESILIPFGYTLEKLELILNQLKLPGVIDVSVLPRVGVG
jgi:DNA polymerase I